MKKLLKPLDVFLLGLSGIVTIFEEFKDPLDLTKAPYEDLQHWVHPRFRKTDYYQMTYHALKTGCIEKIIKGGRPYFRLTSRGKEKTYRDFSLSKWQEKKWDGKWRVVIFDIEEKSRKKRDLLRLKLRELGFGMIQESVWISPYDIIVDFREFVRAVGLADQVFALEVSGLLAGDEKSLAAKIWHLEKINDDYKDLFEILTKLHDRVKMSRGEKEREEERKKEGEKAEAEEEIKKRRGEYLEILRKDPCLPKELLPEDWFGERVKRLILVNFG